MNIIDGKETTSESGSSDHSPRISAAMGPRVTARCGDGSNAMSSGLNRAPYLLVFWEFKCNVALSYLRTLNLKDINTNGTTIILTPFFCKAVLTFCFTLTNIVLDTLQVFSKHRFCTYIYTQKWNIAKAP